MCEPKDMVQINDDDISVVTDPEPEKQDVDEQFVNDNYEEDKA